MTTKKLTIADLQAMYKKLELNPPYQRRPVWKTKQRQLLLASIFNGIPIPALIFHKQKIGKKEVYNVLDGKQRIETILHFIEAIDILGEENWTIKVNKNAEETVNSYIYRFKIKKV